MLKTKQQNAPIAARGAGQGAEVPTAQRIREAAIGLFAEEGYAATGIRDIGKRAGISTSVLYHYVSNKEQLLAEIMLDGLTNVLSAGRRAVAAEDDPALQLARLVVTHMSIEVGHVASSAVIDREFGSLGDERQAQVLGLRDEYQQLWRDVLKRGTAAGRFEVDDLRLGVLFIIDLCNGIGRWYRPGGRLNLDDVLSHAVDAVFGIVRVDDDGTPLRVAMTTLDIGALIRELDSTPRVTFEGDLAPGTPK